MKKFLAVITALVALVALASASILRREPDILELISQEETVGNASFTATLDGDGRRTINLFSDGQFAGSITEAEVGNPDSLVFIDATSTPISESRLLAANANARIRLPGGKLFQLLRRFAAFIKRWGSRFYDFIVCLGINVGGECVDEIISCAQAGEAPWECLESIVCGGKAFKDCLR